MTAVVEVAGSLRTLDVRPDGRDFEIVVDGRRLAADLVQAGATWSLLIREVETGPADTGEAEVGWTMESFEIAIDGHPGQPLTVWVEGRPVTVSLDPRSSRAGADRRRETDTAAGRRSIVAPMPGRVVEVFAAVGDRVRANQGLVVVEAMKMENELRAPCDGTVTEVRVAKGAPVEANAVLVVVEQ